MRRFTSLRLISLLISFLWLFGYTEATDDKIRILVCDFRANSLVKLIFNGSYTEEVRFVTTIMPAGIAYDPVSEQIYWSQYRPYLISRTDIKGETVTILANLSSSARPYALTIDEFAGKLFYADWGNHEIVSMDLEGSNATTILDSTSVDQPHQLACIRNKRKIVWSDKETGHKISLSNYDGSNIQRIVSTTNWVWGLAIDEENDVLFWSEYSTGRIQSVSMDGSNRRQIYRDSGKNIYDIFLVDEILYFTAQNQRVFRIPVEGGEVEEIPSKTVFDHPHGLYVLSNENNKPKIESRLIHTDDLHSELVFLCNFSQHSEDVFYSTSWFVEDKLVLSSDPEKWFNGSVIENQVLTETHLREANIKTYSIQISCSVEATYEEGNVSTPAVLSRKRFVGIKVSSTSVRVAQGRSAGITLSLTDPFGCGKHTNTDECRLRVKVHTLRDANECEQAVLMPSECGASFVASQWDESVTISLFGKVTSTYGSSSKEVNLKLTTPFMWAHEMWGEAQLSQIQVQLTKDTSHIQWKSCHSNNDPHMKTFDGRYYEHQYGGIFTLYKHLELPLEVQIQTARCSYSQNAWCNCGVAVRAGGTVFEINRCPGQSDIWYIDYTLCEDGGNVLQVTRRGGNYDLYLPTGAKLMVNIYGVFLNLQMYPSVQDTEKSVGLCGKMSDNGACSDDFILRDGTYSTDPTATESCSAGYRVWENLLIEFSNSWRVEFEESLFDHSDLHSLSNWPQQSTYCTCSEDKELNDPLPEVECSASKAHETCKTLPGYSDVIPSRCSINRRRRISVYETEEPIIHKRTKRSTNPWPEGWTEATATAHCQKLFGESRTVQVCGNITGVDTNSSIDSCILDIKLTGTTDFGKYSVDSVRSKCYHEVVVNPVLQDNKTSDSPSVYDIVVAEACPNDCSGHGNCSEGECSCVRNFGGQDCSVDLSAPPVLSSIQDHGHCDTSSVSCDVISVYGETFTEDRTLCMVHAFKVSETGLESKGSSKSAAIIHSISEAKCTISAFMEKTRREYVRAYRISVSNDGENFSNNVSLLVYDSTCVIGHINGSDFNWTKEPSYCLYGESCFGNGTSRTDDECSLCWHDGSTAQWVNSRAPTCTSVEKVDNTIFIIAGVGGALAAAVIVVVAAICVIVLKNKRSKSP